MASAYAKIVIGRSFPSLLAAGFGGAAAALLQLLERGLAGFDGLAQVAALLLVKLFGLLHECLQFARITALDGVGNRYVVGSHIGHGSSPFAYSSKTMAVTPVKVRAHVRALQSSSRSLDDRELDALLGIAEREERLDPVELILEHGNELIDVYDGTPYEVVRELFRRLHPRRGDIFYDL